MFQTFCVKEIFRKSYGAQYAKVTKRIADSRSLKSSKVSKCFSQAHHGLVIYTIIALEKYVETNKWLNIFTKNVAA